MRHHSVLLTALGIPALVVMMGATNCEYYSTVTVPATDTTDPLLGTRLFFFGEEEIALWPIYRETSDPDAVFVVFPSVFDSGGARSIDVSQSVEVYCDGGPGAVFHYIPLHDEQAGTVGSKVSNGLYVQGNATSFGDYTYICGSPSDVEEIVYTWGITGEDFAGNQATMIGGQITFTP